MTTKAHIISLLETRDAAVAKALVVLNERQTATEQNAESTINRNGRGFAPADARMGTSMAVFFQKRGYLSPKQLAYWRKPNKNGVMRIAKYAGQLLEIAKAKTAAATAQAFKSPAPRTMAGDVGNLLEEQATLQEVLSGYQEGAMGDGPEQHREMDAICDRLTQISEQLEEISRCQYKMQRDRTVA